jgi:hypothetical protein
MGQAAPPLSLFVRCHHWLVAVPALAVTQLALIDEPGWRLEPGGSGLGTLTHPQGSCQVHDLGTLLDMPPTAQVWLRLASGEGPNWALRTGRCLHVGALPPSLPLPPGGSRRRLGLRIFSAQALAIDVSSMAPIGLALELPLLLQSRA